IKAVDNGRPQKSSTCRLHIEWIPKPEPSSSLLAFDESVFSFTVMESDPVAHMVGVITMETVDTPVWFEITGGNSDHRFDVDKASGTLVVARPLNTEQKSNYNLTLEATDGTRTTSTQAARGCVRVCMSERGQREGALRSAFGNSSPRPEASACRPD
ncbi:hypothetical protein AOLI_G00330130, partial [Acnodon oligacanthus]